MRIDEQRVIEGPIQAPSNAPISSPVVVPPPTETTGVEDPAPVGVPATTPQRQLVGLSNAESSGVSRVGATGLTRERQTTAGIELEARALMDEELRRATGAAGLAAGAQQLALSVLEKRELKPDDAKDQMTRLATTAKLLDSAIHEETARLASAQRDAQMTDMEVAGQPDKASARAAARLAIGHPSLVLSPEAPAPLADRLEDLRDARTNVLLAQLHLATISDPTQSLASLTTPLQADLTRYQGLLTALDAALATLPADGDPRPLTAARNAVAAQVEILTATLRQVSGRFLPYAEGLRSIAKTFGLTAPANNDFAALATTLRAIETELGLPAPELPTGHDGVVALDARLDRLVRSRNSALVQVALWLREDGVPMSELVGSGLLAKDPQRLTASELETIGLADATPGKLRPAEVTQAMLALLQPDSRGGRGAISRLSASMFLGERRDPATDLRELATMALKTQPRRRGATSLLQVRQRFVGDRQVLSDTDLIRLSQWLGDRKLSLSQIVTDRNAPVAIRQIASKLAAHPSVIAHLTGGADATLVRSRIDDLAGRLSGYVYPRPDDRVLDEQGVQIIRTLLARTGAPLTADELAAIAGAEPEKATLRGANLRPEEEAVLRRIAANPALHRLLFADQRLALEELPALTARLGDFREPVPVLDGKMVLAGFYPLTELASDVSRLRSAIDREDPEAIVAILQRRTGPQRQLLATEYARQIRQDLASRGRVTEENSGDALAWRLQRELSGWTEGRALHMLRRDRGPNDWMADLLAPPNLPAIGATFVDKEGKSHDARTAAGLFAATHEYFWRHATPPERLTRMDNQRAVDAYRALQQKAEAALADYAVAVNSNKPAAEIERLRQEFARHGGTAIANLETLTAADRAEEARDEAVFNYSAMGAVVVGATAITIFSAGTLAGAGYGMVTAAGTGILAGATSGVAVGAAARYGRHVFDSRTLALDQAAVDALMRGVIEDGRTAAGAAIAAAIPVAAAGRLRVICELARGGRSLSALQRAAYRVAQLPAAVQAPLVTTTTGTAGAFGMRSANAAINHGIAAGQESTGFSAAGRELLAQINIDETVDTALSGQNLFVEIVSHSLSGTANRWLSFLDDAGRLGASARSGSGLSRLGAELQRSRALRETLGISLDAGVLNPLDEMMRNRLYGRDAFYGLRDALILGAPGTIAGNRAARAVAANRDAQPAARATQATPPEASPPSRLAETEHDITTANTAEMPIPSPIAATDPFEQLPSPMQRRLGSAGRDWFNSLDERNRLAANLLLPHLETADAPLAFETAHLQGMLDLTRRGFPAELAASLPADAVDYLAKNLNHLCTTDFVRRWPGEDGRGTTRGHLGDTSPKRLEGESEAVFAERLRKRAEGQQRWDDLVALITPDQARQVAEALRPAMQRDDWNTLIRAARSTPHGRELLARHKAATFALHAAAWLDHQPPNTPMAEILAQHETRWAKFRQEYQLRQNASGDPRSTNPRHQPWKADEVITLAERAPGLGPSRPRDVAELRAALENAAFRVYSGIVDPAMGFAGYAGTSHRHTRGGTDIHLLPGDRQNPSWAQRMLLTFEHERDHVERRFYYRDGTRPENVAHNLLGETLAPLREQARLDPEVLRRALQRREDDVPGTLPPLTEFLIYKLKDYGRPNRAGAKYFSPEDMQPVEMVRDRLLAVAYSDPSRDPLDVLVSVLLDGEGTGMLGTFDTPLRPDELLRRMDVRSQETLRRLGVSEETVAEGIQHNSWSSTTAARVTALMNSGRLSKSFIAQLTPTEIDALVAMVVDRTEPPEANVALTPDKLRVLLENPGLTDALGVVHLRQFSAEQLRSLALVPALAADLQHLLVGRSVDDIEQLASLRRAIHESRLDPNRRLPMLQALAVRSAGELRVCVELVRGGLPIEIVEAATSNTLVRLRFIQTDLEDGQLSAEGERLVRSLIAELPGATSPLETWILGTFDDRLYTVADWPLRSGRIDPNGLTPPQVAEVRTRLAATGYPEDRLLVLDPAQLALFWATEHVTHHRIAIEYTDRLTASLRADQIQAVQPLVEHLVTRHIRRSLVDMGIDQHTIGTLTGAQAVQVRDWLMQVDVEGVADGAAARAENALHQALGPKAETIMQAVIAGRSRVALVGLGVPQDVVSKLSIDDVLAAEGLRRAAALGLNDAALQPLLGRLHTSTSGSALLPHVDRIRNFGTHPGIAPGFAYTRIDLLAAGLRPQTLARLSSDDIAKLHEVRVLHWMAPGMFVHDLPSRSQAYRDAVEEMRAAQPWVVWSNDPHVPPTRRSGASQEAPDVPRVGKDAAGSTDTEPLEPLPLDTTGQPRRTGIRGLADRAAAAVQSGTAWRRLPPAVLAQRAIAAYEKVVPEPKDDGRTPNLALEGPVREVVERAYRDGLEVPPEAFDVLRGLDADPRQAAFMKGLWQHLEALRPNLRRLEGTPTQPEESGLIRFKTAEGDFFVKPLGEGRLHALGNVFTSIGNELLGMKIAVDAELVVLPDGRLAVAMPRAGQVGHHIDLRSNDPRARRGLSNLRAFDYIFGVGDRGDMNVIRRPETEELVGIDNDYAMTSALVGRRRGQAISGGRLPDVYSLEMRQAVARLTPEIIRQRFAGLASPAEIDMMIVRLNVVRADMNAKPVLMPDGTVRARGGNTDVDAATPTRHTEPPQIAGSSGDGTSFFAGALFSPEGRDKGGSSPGKFRFDIIARAFGAQTSPFGLALIGSLVPEGERSFKLEATSIRRLEYQFRNEDDHASAVKALEGVVGAIAKDSPDAARELQRIAQLPPFPRN